MAIELTPDESMANAIHSVRMEGLEIAPEDRAILERIVRGEITHAEACAQIIARAKAMARGQAYPPLPGPTIKPEQ
jgi:hypothetical protein